MIKKKPDVKKLRKKPAMKRSLIQAWIPASLHKRVKKKTKQDKISMSAFISESLRMYVE